MYWDFFRSFLNSKICSFIKNNEGCIYYKVCHFETNLSTLAGNPKFNHKLRYRPILTILKSQIS